jgi:predicted PurR-regulated permease PerM
MTSHRRPGGFDHDNDIAGPANDAATRGGACCRMGDTGGSDIVRVAATLVSAAVIIAALYYGQDILIPLAFAFLIGFALNPPVMWLRRRGLHKVIAIATVMTVVLVLLASLFLVLGTQLRSLGEQLPTYQSTIHGKFNDLKAQFKAPGMLDGALNAIASLQKEVEAVQGAEAQRVEIVSGPSTSCRSLWCGSGVSSSRWLRPASSLFS